MTTPKPPLRARARATLTHPAVSQSLIAGGVAWLLVTYVWPHGGEPAAVKTLIPYAVAWLAAVLAHWRATGQL